MMSIEEEKIDLQNNIKEMKSGSIEQMCLVTFYCLGAYFKSLFVFGFKNKVTQDNLNIIKEMFTILRVERSLLNYILINIDKFDVYSAQEAVGMLDRLNDRTVEYYYSIINDIEDAAELNEEHRGYRPNRGFSTLIHDNSYACEVIALSENLDTLKSFLGFEDEFWYFIKDKTETIDTSIEVIGEAIYATPIYDENGIVVSIKIMLPKVSNLESSLLAIMVYKKAYELYKQIGKKYDSESLEEATSLQEKYKLEYLPRKVNELLNLKNVEY